MRFDHVVVKGGTAWERFYRDVSRELPRLGLNNDEVESTANVAYVDAVWILGRIARGELIAAQRILHQSVIETNIRLLQELRERSGVPAFHRARRAETVLPAEQLQWIAVDARRDGAALTNATKAAISGTRQLVYALTARVPDWPEL